MDNNSSAEWVLSRRFGVARAREIAGDLLEQHSAGRARWEMIRLAFGIRGIEFAGLLFASITVIVALNLLFSPWQLLWMAQARDLHEGWAWSMSTAFASFALSNSLVTMAAAVRLGMGHGVTRSSLAISLTLCVLSVAMLQSQIWRILLLLIASILLWQLRAFGLRIICRSAAAFAALSVLVNALLHTVRLAELRSCVVNRDAYTLRPAWYDFYASCSPLAFHHLLICVAGALTAMWCLTFTEARASAKYDPSTSEGS